jgi:hypothetical protein
MPRRAIADPLYRPPKQNAPARTFGPDPKHTCHACGRFAGDDQLIIEPDADDPDTLYYRHRGACP